MPSADADGLLARALRLDEDAWEQIYVSTYPRLFGFAARRVDHDRAKDIADETMTRAVSQIATFDPTIADLDPWLFGICRNVIHDHLRKSYRQRRDVEPASIPAPDASEAVELGEEAAAMHAAYRLLSEEDRELLDLRVIAGLTAEQTAQALGKRAGAVRMAQSRALDRLRRHFREVYR